MHFEPHQNHNQEPAHHTQNEAICEHGVQLFTEENQGGVGCVRCHGPGLQGSRILNTTTGTPVLTPNLTTVCGGPFTGHPLIYGQRDIYTTIEQGRNLMPSWSIRYEGALNDQQINDIVNYIISIQDPDQVTKDKNVCTNPEAQAAAIEQFLDGDVTKKPSPTDNVEL
jgi:mono/diheme cytochrome c family protein